MALVAFLASAIAPRVAAACAHAALAALSAENKIQMEGSLQSQRSNDSVGQSEDGAASAVSPDKVKAAARVGLAAAATKAKLLADHEEREIQRLSANIVHQQLKRLELKLKQFAEIEMGIDAHVKLGKNSLLIRECNQMEKGRQRLAAERARIISSNLDGPAYQSKSPTCHVGPNTFAARYIRRIWRWREQSSCTDPTFPNALHATTAAADVSEASPLRH